MVKKRKKKTAGMSDKYLDDLVRKVVYLMSGGYCKRCKRYIGVADLQAAHIYRRRHKTVRFDLRNVQPLCLECHTVVDKDPVEMTSFMYDIMTPEEVKDLQELARKTIKDHPIDREQIKTDLKERIRKLE